MSTSSATASSAPMRSSCVSLKFATTYSPAPIGTTLSSRVPGCTYWPGRTVRSPTAPSMGARTTAYDWLSSAWRTAALARARTAWARPMPAGRTATSPRAPSDAATARACAASRARISASACCARCSDPVPERTSSLYLLYSARASVTEASAPAWSATAAAMVLDWSRSCAWRPSSSASAEATSARAWSSAEERSRSSKRTSTSPRRTD